LIQSFRIGKAADDKIVSATGVHAKILGVCSRFTKYSDVDKETAKTLDKFLDGACLKLPSRR
jgi:hypothetical protein